MTARREVVALLTRELATVPQRLTELIAPHLRAAEDTGEPPATD